MDIDDVTLLYRVRKTVHQMLKDRGYIVREDRIKESKQDFATWYEGKAKKRDALNMMVEKRRDHADASEFAVEEESQKMIVFFPDVEKLNMADLR